MTLHMPAGPKKTVQVDGGLDDGTLPHNRLRQADDTDLEFGREIDAGLTGNGERE